MGTTNLKNRRTWGNKDLDNFKQFGAEVGGAGQVHAAMQKRKPARFGKPASESTDKVESVLTSAGKAAKTTGRQIAKGLVAPFERAIDIGVARAKKKKKR